MPTPESTSPEDDAASDGEALPEDSPPVREVTTDPDDDSPEDVLLDADMSLDDEDALLDDDASLDVEPAEAPEDEPVASAPATPGEIATTTPIPRAAANAPTRPT